ncbi:MAG TPA: DUF296 domain-containing protein [Burkholderiales bacterium]|nr:DUF296 domain-containing protein [Burkholderiales bacterium]
MKRAVTRGITLLAMPGASRSRGTVDADGALRTIPIYHLRSAIALEGKRAKVHAHVVLGWRDSSARDGHLLEGRVRPTLEVILTDLQIT